MKWLALLSLIAANLVRLPSPVVKISSGLVKGRVSENGKFYEYFGIPYGVVDERNRFQAPLPPPKWDGIFSALNENIWCPQKTVANIVLGEPNCLKLNVYTPVHTSYQPLPVMVFIHGGCFITGTGSPFLYGGDYFAEHEVVFVALNYRLNVEGFLCLGIKEAPGNAGLKDQIAALKWIQENIKSFGGDPDNVTLFGESAGAVSTSFMILSPAAKGLFHKAILQSGSSLAPWALQHDPIKTASELVKKFGYNTKDPRQIHRILSRKSAKELNNAFDYSERNKFCVADENIFVPCIEKHIDDVEPVITEYPADVIKSGNYTKVPMIIGFNDNEGYYFVATDYGTSLKNDSELDLTRPLQTDLEFPTEYDKNSTAELLRRHYFSSCEEDVIMNMVDLYSDLHFKFPLVLESQLYAQTTDKPLYFYLFKYSGYINMPKIISGFGLSGGASHADDLFYMFKPHSFPLPHRYLENDMIKRMVTLWTNFAKFSDPTPNTTSLLPIRWYPSHEMNPTALAIGDDITTTSMWDHVSVGIWNDTYNKYRRKNYGFKHHSQYSNGHYEL